MSGNTSIQITRDTKKELDNKKITQGETYNDVICRLIEETTDELGFTLYNSIFNIDCIADIEDEDNEHFYFLNDLGDKTEVLRPTESFVDEGVQKEYLAFIDAINAVCEADLNLLDYGTDLHLGEVYRFDGFNMKRTY